LTWREAEALLSTCGEDPQSARQAADLLTTIESATYSGVALNPDQQNDLLEHTRKMVARLVS
jgi:hypothetical protein